MFRKSLIIFVITSFSFTLFGQKTDFKEITNSDITKYKKIKSENISVFGLNLGMTPNEVYDVLKENNDLLYYVDEMHMTADIRIYVYDKDDSGKEKNCILYLIWENSRKELSKITFFEDISPYLHKNSSKLLTTEPFSKSTKIYKNFLGDPDRSEITLNIPSIQMKHTTFFYDSKGIKITFKDSSEKKSVVFALYLID